MRLIDADRAMEISALEKTKWISVNERLPEEKVNCIVHYKHAYCDAVKSKLYQCRRKDKHENYT